MASTMFAAIPMLIAINPGLTERMNYTRQPTLHLGGKAQCDKV